MYYLTAIEYLHSLDDLGEDGECFCLGQGLPGGDEVGEGAVFAVFHEDVEIVLGFLDVDEPHDVLVAAFLEDGDLSLPGGDCLG